MGCDPTGMLRDEHQLILEVVDSLERLLDREPAATSAELRDCVDFFRLYTDALHHGKEEDVLFESLADHGMSRHSGPIAVMLQEHELGRSLIRQMARALDAGDTDTFERTGFEHAGRLYINLLRQHIGKENHALFEMADAILDEPACRDVCDAYDAVCARSFEGRTLEELQALAAGILDTSDR